MRMAHFGAYIELRFGFQLGASASDDVEAAGIPISAEEFGCDLPGLVIEDAGGTAEEAYQF